jgi:hypothetical protein
MSEQRARPLPHDASPDEEKTTTVRPPFDPEEYARESDSKIRIEASPPSARPTAPPPPGLPQYTPGLASGTMHSLGSVSSDAVPALAMAEEDLAWFDLPKVARALILFIDGQSTLGAICVRAGLALDAAMAACHELERQGIVTLRR